jgi:Histidinol phosphatase and related phosphatases
MSESSLAEINEYMLELISAAGGVIRDTRYCIHKPRARCSCRKPMPGMLNDLIEAYGID